MEIIIIIIIIALKNFQWESAWFSSSHENIPWKYP